MNARTESLQLFERNRLLEFRKELERRQGIFEQGTLGSGTVQVGSRTLSPATGIAEARRSYFQEGFSGYIAAVVLAVLQADGTERIKLDQPLYTFWCCDHATKPQAVADFFEPLKMEYSEDEYEAAKAVHTYSEQLYANR